MKNSLLSSLKAWLTRDQSKEQNSVVTEATSYEERFQQIFLEELQEIKQNPQWYAYLSADARIDRENQQREDELVERRERTERLMQSSGNYTSIHEPHREKDEPDLEPD